MSIDSTPTAVTYPSGAVNGSAILLHAVDRSDFQCALFVDVTPFHPLDHKWPDQPADRGVIIVDGGTHQIADVETAAKGLDGAVLFGSDIPVPRGTDGWTFLVAHVVTGTASEFNKEIGSSVELKVDAEYRLSLSQAHSACHLVAFAYNEVTADGWRREPPLRDSRGNPNLDSLAMEESRIGEGESTDRYRFGKSLRKKGFNPTDLGRSWADIKDQINEKVAAWIATDARVTVDVPSDALDAMRVWRCALPEGEASIPCGGTHVSSLSALGSVRVSATSTKDGTELTLRTEVNP